MTPDQRAHIEQLAQENAITLRFSASRTGGAAAHKERWVRLPALDSGVLDSELYWIALHELGHIVAGRHPGYRPDWLSSMLGLPIPGRVANEARAWAWALDNARFPLDRIARTTIAAGLGSYLANNDVPLEDENLRRIVTVVGSDVDRDMYREHPDSPANRAQTWDSWARLVQRITGQPTWRVPEPTPWAVAA